MGFRRIEYLQFNGQQTINTSISGKAKWVFDVQFTADGSRQLMGYSGNGSEYWGVQTDNGYGIGPWNEMSYKAGNRDKVIHCYGENNEYYVEVYHNEVFKGKVTFGYTDIGSNNYVLGNLGPGSSFGCKMKIYGIQCYQNNRLVRNFIPANDNGENGLYDTISSGFFRNYDRGGFGAGATKNNIAFGKNGELFCNTVNYNYKQARNMIADNSIADMSGAWSSASWEDNKGYKCYRCIKASSSMPRQILPNFIGGHKYYFSCRLNTTNGGNYSVCLRNNGDIGGSYLQRGSTGGNWVLSSKIWACPSNSNGTTDVVCWNGNSNPVYTCKWILLDLTDTFGSGNEPSKEWCDSNIREQEVFQNFGCGTGNVPNNNLDKYYAQQLSKANYNWLQLNSSYDPRSYMYHVTTNSGYGEGFLIHNGNANVGGNKRYYFQAYTNTQTTNYGVSTQCYFPIAEPNMGTNYNVPNSAFNGGGGMIDWKVSSFFSNRYQWNGNYSLRFDIDNRRNSYKVKVTGLQLIYVQDNVDKYNSYYGTRINIDQVNKEWCDRWIDGRSSPILHIKDHRNTKITFLKHAKKVNTQTRNYSWADFSSWHNLRNTSWWIADGYDNSHLKYGDLAYLDSFDSANNNHPMRMYIRIHSTAKNYVYCDDLCAVYDQTSNGYIDPYNISCNDIEIRPELNKVVMDKTGTIKCRKLCKIQEY